MKFVKGEFFLLPSSKAMIECKVLSVNSNKDKVTFQIDTDDKTYLIDTEIRYYMNKYNINFSVTKAFRSIYITFRCSEVCHHIKPLGEAYNLIYAN